MPQEERSALLAGVLDGVELGAWDWRVARLAGRAGYLDAGDDCVVDRAVTGCGAGPVSGIMRSAVRLLPAGGHYL